MLLELLSLLTAQLSVTWQRSFIFRTILSATSWWILGSTLFIHSYPLACCSYTPAHPLTVLCTIILRIIGQLFVHLPVSLFYCLSAFIAHSVYNRVVRAWQLRRITKKKCFQITQCPTATCRRNCLACYICRLLWPHQRRQCANSFDALHYAGKRIGAAGAATQAHKSIKL